MYKEDKISILISTVTGSFALHDIKTVLDIVLLVLSILNIIIVLVFKLCRYLKDGKLDNEEKADLKKDLKSLSHSMTSLLQEDKEGSEEKCQQKAQKK